MQTGTAPLGATSATRHFGAPRSARSRPPVAIQPVAIQPVPMPERPKPKLSPREIEVMLHWFAHDSKTATCRELYITMGTVNTHLNRIRDKYQAIGRPAQTKAALLARALQDGLIDLEDL